MFADSVVTPVVDLLAELAGSGRALELGIGTGRIALPLAARACRQRHRISEDGREDARKARWQRYPRRHR
jgi:methylase of polypeptide subunit release factors